MYRYISYDIENIENIKISKTMNQLETEETLSYIPGTSLRGAYITEYIRKNNISNINSQGHREKLLAGGIQFMNAYPTYRDARSRPLVKCFFADKKDLRLGGNKIAIKNGLGNKLPMGYKKLRVSDFVYMDDDSLYKVDIRKGENLHINKRKKENILFRYEYLDKGQKFRALVKIEEEYIEEFVELFEDSIVYIGGSKGSGYGRCKIGNIKIHDENPESFRKFDFKDELYILALSDIVYRNKNGQYSTDLDIEELSEGLGLELKLLDSAIDTINISNFNNKWNARTPNVVSISKGSVFRYSFIGEPDTNRITSLIEEGLGERKEDGFGRIDIMSGLDYDFLYTEDREIKEPSQKQLEAHKQKELDLIYSEILKSRIDLELAKLVLELDKEYSNLRMSNNQKGIWMGLFESLLYLPKDQGIEKLNKYLDHIKHKSRTSQKELDRNEGLEKKIRNLAKTEDVGAFMNQFEAVKEGIDFNDSLLSKEDVYFYNIRMLKEFFRFKINSRSVKED